MFLGKIQQHEAEVMQSTLTIDPFRCGRRTTVQKPTHNEDPWFVPEAASLPWQAPRQHLLADRAMCISSLVLKMDSQGTSTCPRRSITRFCSIIVVQVIRAQHCNRCCISTRAGRYVCRHSTSGLAATATAVWSEKIRQTAVIWEISVDGPGHCDFCHTSHLPAHLPRADLRACRWKRKQLVLTLCPSRKGWKAAWERCAHSISESPLELALSAVHTTKPLSIALSAKRTDWQRLSSSQGVTARRGCRVMRAITHHTCRLCRARTARSTPPAAATQATPSETRCWQ